MDELKRVSFTSAFLKFLNSAKASLTAATRSAGWWGSMSVRTVCAPPLRDMRPRMVVRNVSAKTLFGWMPKCFAALYEDKMKVSGASAKHPIKLVKVTMFGCSCSPIANYCQLVEFHCCRVALPFSSLASTQGRADMHMSIGTPVLFKRSRTSSADARTPSTAAASMRADASGALTAQVLRASAQIF